jgi:ribosomal protein L37E
MSACQVTKCPPRNAYLLDPEQPVFGMRRSENLAVSATYHGAAGWSSPGISFGDYDGMATQTHKITIHRRRPMPDFMNHPDQLRAIIVRFVEQRAFGHHTEKLSGTLAERLVRAEQELLARRPGKIKVFDGLCERWAELKNAGDPYAAKVALQIEVKDTELRMDERITAIITAVLYLSYKVGMKSNEVSAELGGIKPPLVRQILHRCRALADGKRRNSPTRAGQPEQERRRAAGLCRRCGRALDTTTSQLCAHCRPAFNEKYKVWRAAAKVAKRARS